MVENKTNFILMILLVVPFFVKSVQNSNNVTQFNNDDEFDALVEIKFKKPNPKVGLNSNSENWVKLPCQLNHDPSCSLAWFYEPKTDDVSFQLTFKIPHNSTWIAIGFNTITKMIGTSVIMIKLDGANLKLFNGFLKYYNRPLIENTDLTEIRKEENNGLMTLTFKRSASLPTISNIDLNECNYVVVATGPLVDDQIRTHIHVPQFTSQCFRLASKLSVTTKKTLLPLSSLSSSKSVKIFDFTSLLPKMSSKITSSSSSPSSWKSLKIGASTRKTQNNLKDFFINFGLVDKMGEKVSQFQLTSKSSKSMEKPKKIFMNKVVRRGKKPIFNEFLIDDKLVRYASMLLNVSKSPSESTALPNTSSSSSYTTTKKISHTMKSLGRNLSDKYSHFESKKVLFNKNGFSTGSITSRSLEINSSKLTTTKMKISTKLLISKSNLLISNSTTMSLVQVNDSEDDKNNKSNNLAGELFLVDFVVKKSLNESIFNRSSTEFINFDRTVKNYIKNSFESKSLIGYNYSEISNIIPQKEGYLLRVMLLYSYKNQSNQEPSSLLLHRLKSSLESGDQTIIPIDSKSIRISEYKNEFQGQKMVSSRGSMSYMFLFIFVSVFGSLSLFCTAFLLIVYYIYQKKISYNLVNISKVSDYLVRV